MGQFPGCLEGRVVRHGGRNNESELALEQTIRRFNHLTVEGVNTDFQAFGPRTSPKSKPIEKPPFYAARFYPITRKSMGACEWMRNAAS